MEANKHGKIPMVCDECKVLLYISPVDIADGCGKCKSANVRQVPEEEAKSLRLIRDAFSAACKQHIYNRAKGGE